MEINRGSVVLIVGPGELGKPRPGVVIQADKFANEISTVFVCPISSDIQTTLSLRPIIDVTPENGLRLRSQVMTDKMFALRRDRIRRVIGQIDALTSEQLDRALLVLLGLAL